MSFLTIFTATYNRGYIIGNLFESLKRQTLKDFQWVVIDDGSSDNTSELFDAWLQEDCGFPVIYKKVENGGKQRAINQGVQLAKTPYIFIVDSDDILSDDAVESIFRWTRDIDALPEFAGVAGVKGDLAGNYIDGKEPLIPKDQFVDATNLERRQYHIPVEMAEVFKTDILRRYPFPVWKDEKFISEGYVWDSIAMDGYKLRWYNRIIYKFEYQEDGYVRNGNKIYRENLIGAARMYDLQERRVKVFHNGKFSWTWLKYMLYLTREIGVACCLKGDLSFLRETHRPWVCYLQLPLAWLLSLKRRRIIWPKEQRG